MSMTSRPWAYGDTVPLEAHLPVDLTTASSVSFWMGDSDGNTVIDYKSAVIDNKVPEDGIVYYQWASTETERLGRHNIRWRVTWDSGNDEHFPKDVGDELYFFESGEH